MLGDAWYDVNKVFAIIYKHGYDHWLELAGIEASTSFAPIAFYSTEKYLSKAKRYNWWKAFPFILSYIA